MFTLQRIHFRLRKLLFLDIFNVQVLLRLLLSDLQAQSAVANHLPPCQRLPVVKPSSVFRSELGSSCHGPLHCVSLLLLFILFGESFDVTAHLLKHRVVSVLHPAKTQRAKKVVAVNSRRKTPTS